MAQSQTPSKWKCNEDLEVEWDHFTNDCRRNTHTDDLNSELWMNFWRQGNVPTRMPSNLSNEEPSFHRGFIEPTERETELPNSSPLSNRDKVSTLSDSQHQQIVNIVSELLDVLDMSGENLPDELKNDIKSYSQYEVSLIFKELGLRLTDQGFYSLCSLLCEDTSLNSWVNISLVFDEIFLPMLSEKSYNSLGEEIKAGLKLLTEHYPLDCVSHMLIPLLSNNVTAQKQLELLSDLVPALPRSDFSELLRIFIQHCKAPIEEWKILVLTCFLSTDRVDDVVMKTDSPLLNLLPQLSLSARTHAANESFATLILKIIPALKSHSPQVLNEMMEIVQQSNSFNKQTMLNALKS